MMTDLIYVFISAAKCLLWVGLGGVLELIEFFCCK